MINLDTDTNFLFSDVARHGVISPHRWGPTSGRRRARADVRLRELQPRRVLRRRRRRRWASSSELLRPPAGHQDGPPGSEMRARFFEPQSTAASSPRGRADLRQGPQRDLLLHGGRLSRQQREAATHVAKNSGRVFAEPGRPRLFWFSVPASHSGQQ